MEFVKIDNNFKDKEKLYSLNDEAFPKEERIPSEKLIGVLKECSCDGWAFYEDEFVGFAIIIPIPLEVSMEEPPPIAIR